MMGNWSEQADEYYMMDMDMAHYDQLEQFRRAQAASFGKQQWSMVSAIDAVSRLDEMILEAVNVGDSHLQLRVTGDVPAAWRDDNGSSEGECVYYGEERCVIVLHVFGGRVLVNVVGRRCDYNFMGVEEKANGSAMMLEMLKVFRFEGLRFWISTPQKIQGAVNHDIGAQWSSIVARRSEPIYPEGKDGGIGTELWYTRFTQAMKRVLPNVPRPDPDSTREQKATRNNIRRRLDALHYAVRNGLHKNTDDKNGIPF